MLLVRRGRRHAAVVRALSTASVGGLAPHAHIESYFRACNTGAAADIANHFTEHAVLFDTNHKPIRGATSIGAACVKIRERWGGVWSLQSCVSNDTAAAAAVEWAMTGTDQRQGRTFTFRGSEHYSFEDGRFAEVRQCTRHIYSPRPSVPMFESIGLSRPLVRTEFRGCAWVPLCVCVRQTGHLTKRSSIPACSATNTPNKAQSACHRGQEESCSNTRVSRYYIEGVTFGFSRLEGSAGWLYMYTTKTVGCRYSS
jgi:ketosteroid isomerase-like protein